LWATRFRGKLKGAMAHTTPTGTRMVNAILPSAPGAASTGTCSPWIRLASSPLRERVWTARSTSTRAYFRGLPASRVMVSANSSFRWLNRSPARRRISNRWYGERGRSSRARWAARTASSTSPSSASATSRHYLLPVLVQHGHKAACLSPLPVDVQSPPRDRHRGHGVTSLGYRFASPTRTRTNTEPKPSR